MISVNLDYDEVDKVISQTLSETEEFLVSCRDIQSSCFSMDEEEESEKLECHGILVLTKESAFLRRA